MVLVVVVSGCHHNELALVPFLELQHLVEREGRADVRLHDKDEVRFVNKDLCASVQQRSEPLHGHDMLRLLQVDYVEVKLGHHAVNERFEVVRLILAVEEHILHVVLSTELLEGLQMVKDDGVAANCSIQRVK